MAISEVGSRNQLRQLLFQIHIMKSYAIGQGMTVPPEAAGDIAKLGSLTEASPTNSATIDKTGEVGDLTWMPLANVAEALKLAFLVHARLATLVKPATPESLEASQPRKGIDVVASPRVTDLLVLTTIAAVVIFLLGLRYQDSAGLPSQLSNLGSSILGASFAGLYTAFKYQSTRTFDPLYNATYLTRLLLGTVSGLILANFGGQLAGSQDGPLLKTATPAVFGLIGGYSADAVNLILQRVADTLVAAVKGSGDDMLKAKQTQLQAEAKTSDLQQRQTIASELGELLAKNPDSAMKASIQRLMSSVGKGQDISGSVNRE